MFTDAKIHLVSLEKIKSLKDRMCLSYEKNDDILLNTFKDLPMSGYFTISQFSSPLEVSVS